MHEFTVMRGRTRLEAEARGSATGPVVLLIAGTSCTRDWWPPALCDQLASLGARVVRFDQRDTGASSTWPVGAPAYGLVDLVDDAVGILEAAGADRAHIVGFSQGGWVAQLLALDHAPLVASLTLVSTRPTEHGEADPDLPEVADSLLAAWSESTEPDWDNPNDVLDRYVEGERLLAGTSFIDADVRAMCRAAIERSTNPQAAGNHPSMRHGPRWRERLGSIQAPSVVMHGTDDPLFPVGNASALAAEIPGASLRVMAGVGHELPERTWATLVGIVDQHLRREAS